MGEDINAYFYLGTWIGTCIYQAYLKSFLFQSEYDNYITKLLDSQTPQHSRLLRDQVEQMSARGTSRPEELQDAKDKVSRLEEEALSLLEENKK